MNIRRWYSNQGFLKKALYTYLICAAIPMMLFTFYYYMQTRAILEEQAYSEMQQSVDTMESGLNLLFQPYATITRTLGNDKTMNILLNRDYSDQSYADLAYYFRTTWDNIPTLYPTLRWLRVYSNNTTLPENNYYFYRLNNLCDAALEMANSQYGYLAAVGDALETGEDEILLLAKLNYFSSDVFQNYLALNLRQEAVTTQLKQVREGRNAYLLDSRGIILASAEGELEGQNFKTRQENWEAFPDGQIQIETCTDGISTMCLRVNLTMGMSLVMTVDRDILLRDTMKIPLRGLAVFLVLTMLALILAVMHSHTQTRRLQEILEATKIIGDGRFDCILEDESKDELGQIAHAVNQMNSQIDSLIRENYERQLKIKSSEMNLLQEQINPHFLYNALAVISSVSMREGGKQTMQSVRYLSDFYRMSLSKGRQNITVGEEVALLQNYMKIQMLRFSDTLEITYDIDPAVTSWSTIKLILQPLVENAIHHGRQEDRVLHIRIRVGQAENNLFYEVEDDGAGIEPEKLETLRTELATTQEGFGLKNVDIRIKLNYGEAYGVSVSSTLGSGTLVHVSLPGSRI